MHWLNRLLLRLRTLIGRHRLDQDLEDELASHLILKQKSLEATGMDPEAAARQARQTFGNRGVWKESTREAWMFPLVESVWRDVHFGVRLLLRDKGFLAVALATLTIGIGATTAIFSLINALMIKSLPVQDPQELAVIRITNLPPSERQWVNGREVRPEELNHITFPLFETLKKHNVFAEVFGKCGIGDTVLDLKGAPRQVSADWVTGSYFSGLGVAPRIGRMLDPQDDVRGGSSDGWATVISDQLWEQLFHRDPQAIGTRITIHRIPFTIVGVAPAAFRGINPGHETDAWVPLSALDLAMPEWNWRHERSRGMSLLQVMVRRHAGTTFESTREKLNLMSRALLDEAKPDGNAKHLEEYLAQKIDITPGQAGFSWIARSFGKTLWLLLAAVGSVLLIAATNLTNLLFARAAARHREIAIRLAIGASASRIRHQLILETSLLAVAGTVLGLMFARGLLALAGKHWMQFEAPFDWTVFGFAALALALVVVIAGWLPAWFATRGDLYHRSTHTANTRWTMSLRSGLIVSQMALSVTLLAGAALLIASLRATFQETTGFKANQTVFVRPDLLNAGVSREHMTRTETAILEETRRQPGVQAAAWLVNAPLTGGLFTLSLKVPPRADRAGESLMVHIHQITDGYFAAMGVPLVVGRDFPPLSSSRRMCIVSENLARHLFGSSAGAVGQTIPLGKMSIEIIGVAADAKYSHLREQAPRTIYFPFWFQRSSQTNTLVIKYAGPREALTSALRIIFERHCRRVPLFSVRSFDETVDKLLSTDRLFSRLLTSFAAFGLLISATGVVGLLSYSVQRRRKEIGIRIALGAAPSKIRSQFQQQGLVLGILGLIVGCLLSYFLHRTLDSYLYRTSPADPVVWTSVAIVLLGCAVGASALPAWRASRIDPMETLRVD